MCDNTSAIGIATDSIKQKRSKAVVDMRFHWIRDRVRQAQFTITYIPTQQNFGECTTLRKCTADPPFARCEDLGLGAEAHSCTRGALVGPVSYSQQSTTEGVKKRCWKRDVEKWMTWSIEMEGGQEAIPVKTNSSAIGLKFSILKVKKWNVKKNRMIRIDLF